MTTLAVPPKLMQAAVMHDVHDIRIETMPVPVLSRSELLVRIVASGICSGDLMPWYVRRKAPLVLGHEPAGIVAAIGPGPTPTDREGQPFSVGDRVAIHHHAPCFVCRECVRQSYVHCRTWRSSKIEPGGIAQYVRVPIENLGDTIHLPATMPLRDAVLVEPLGCVMKSLRRARLRAGDAVYVIGLGIMGLLHVAVAASPRRVHTARTSFVIPPAVEVFGSDFRLERRLRADRLGARATFHPEHALTELRAHTAGRGADVVICGAGSREALYHAIEACAPDGTIVMFTPLEPGEAFPFDQSSAYFRDLTLTASYSCGPDDTELAAELLGADCIATAELGMEVFELKDVATAYRQMADGEIVKAVIRFGE